MVEIKEIDADPMEALLGKELIRDARGTSKLATTAALKGKDLVLLYFSASWCPVRGWMDTENTCIYLEWEKRCCLCSRD